MSRLVTLWISQLIVLDALSVPFGDEKERQFLARRRHAGEYRDCIVFVRFQVH
jgi:hypothetical protein